MLSTLVHIAGFPEFQSVNTRLQHETSLNRNTLNVTYFEWFAKRGAYNPHCTKTNRPDAISKMRFESISCHLLKGSARVDGRRRACFTLRRSLSEPSKEVFRKNKCACNVFKVECQLAKANFEIASRFIDCGSDVGELFQNIQTQTTTGTVTRCKVTTYRSIDRNGNSGTGNCTIWHEYYLTPEERAMKPKRTYVADGSPIKQEKGARG